MRDVCLACGRPIFTTPLRNSLGGPMITLAQQWTHGRRRLDRQHAPIPTNHEYRVVR